MANQFDTIRLEKGMYQEAGRSFTQVWRGWTPSSGSSSALTSR